MLKAILSKKDLSKQQGFMDCIQDLLVDKNVRHLMDFSHHSGTTRFQHSLNVSYYNYKVCSFFGLDARSGARAGLLHDLFFYDRKEHTPVKGEGWHGIGHPKVAFFNACDLFPINQREGDMIINHMWPLSPRFPKYRESYVITLVDKFCAVAEVLTHACSLSRRKFKLAEVFALTLIVRMTLH